MSRMVKDIPISPLFDKGDGINENQEYCYLRLPCGICRLTMTNCPKVSEVYSITPTWVSTNCEVNEVNIHMNNEVTE